MLKGQIRCYEMFFMVNFFCVGTTQSNCSYKDGCSMEVSFKF